MKELTHAMISKSADIEWASTPPKWGFPCVRDGRYQIFVASNTGLRQQARNLVRNVYGKRGYIDNSDESAHLNLSDRERPVYTLLAEDRAGEIAGTISLNLDRRAGLPCDEIFGEELDALRKQGRALAEVTGFVISEKHTRSKALLVHLFDFILILARQECPNGMVVIEVNPRHETYYKKRMKFAVAGPIRKCHRVRGAPARLLNLDLTMQQEAIRAEAGNQSMKRIGKSRSLYSHFYTLNDEVHIKRFLARSKDGERDSQEVERFVLAQVS